MHRTRLYKKLFGVIKIMSIYVSDTFSSSLKDPSLTTLINPIAVNILALKINKNHDYIYFSFVLLHSITVGYMHNEFISYYKTLEEWTNKKTINFVNKFLLSNIDSIKQNNCTNDFQIQHYTYGTNHILYLADDKTCNVEYYGIHRTTFVAY